MRVFQAVINICRWAAAIQEGAVLPPISHPLGQTLARASPFTNLGVDGHDVRVTIGARHVSFNLFAIVVVFSVSALYTRCILVVFCSIWWCSVPALYSVHFGGVQCLCCALFTLVVFSACVVLCSLWWLSVPKRGAPRQIPFASFRIH